MPEEKTDDKARDLPTRKPAVKAQKPRLVCHAPFGTLVIDGERRRFRRGDVVSSPDNKTIASADPASWEYVKG